MKKIKDELKKKLVAYLDEWVWEGEYDRANIEDIVEDILSPCGNFPELAVVDRKALPLPVLTLNINYGRIWDDANEAMLVDGWVKEVE